MSNTTLFAVFLVSMVATTVWAFAHKFGFVMPDWTALVALVATAVNYILFGYMVFLPKMRGKF